MTLCSLRNQQSPLPRLCFLQQISNHHGYHLKFFFFFSTSDAWSVKLWSLHFVGKISLLCNHLESKNPTSHCSLFGQQLLPQCDHHFCQHWSSLSFLEVLGWGKLDSCILVSWCPSLCDLLGVSKPSICFSFLVIKIYSHYSSFL